MPRDCVSITLITQVSHGCWVLPRQEECDVLTLVLDKQPGPIHLSEFKVQSEWAGLLPCFVLFSIDAHGCTSGR